MLFYAGIVGITTLLAWVYSHAKGIGTKRVLYGILVMFPATISGLRGVGTDIRQYFFHANDIIAGTYDLVDYKSIFVQITRFLLKFNVNYTIILLIVSIIIIHVMFIVFGAYKKEISFTFAVFSYMLIFYQMSLNTYRQIMAAAFFLLATVYLYKKEDKRRYCFFYVVAVLIHSSILPFGLLFFFKDWITDNKFLKHRIVVYIVISVMIFSIPRMMSKMDFLLRIIPHYGWYITRFKSTGIGFGILRFLVMGVVPVLYLYLKKTNKDLKQIKLEYLPFYTIMGFVLWLTSYISESTIYRISYNLLISLPLLHGYIFRRYLRNTKIVILGAVVTVMLFFWWYDGAVLNTGETVPYRFIWEGVVPIE